MSYYEPQGWQAPVRQPSWEQPPPPSRSGASSTSQREDNYAFASQFEEVDRAIDNLMKSGKFYPPGPRRDLAMMGGGGRFNDHQPRMHGGRQSFNEFDPARPHSASNLQNFYASQRYQGRPNDGEQMAQAKRRLAAQRERELRNYHQEQQYNRSVLAEMSSNKSDRSMSPSTLSEEGRRDLIARQHRALYGNEGAAFLPQGMYGDDNPPHDQAGSVPTSSAGGVRGNSPRGMDPFGLSGQSTQNENAGQAASGQENNRGEKSGSPSTGAAPSFGAFDGPSQPSGKVPTPPAGEEGHSRQVSKSTTAPIGGGMGPIGSRPSTQQAPNPGINKRTTSPLPSSLNYGFGNQEQSNDRAASSNSNANQKDSNPASGMGAWGTSSGVWGSNKMGTTSVWG